MYKQLAVALLALTMTLAVPVSVSADDDCSVPQDETVLDEEGFYVTEDLGVFEETGDNPGLQSEAGSDECDPDDPDDDIEWDADIRHL